jgi:hypothetical protein
MIPSHVDKEIDRIAVAKMLQKFEIALHIVSTIDVLATAVEVAHQASHGCLQVLHRFRDPNPSLLNGGDCNVDARIEPLGDVRLTRWVEVEVVVVRSKLLVSKRALNSDTGVCVVDGSAILRGIGNVPEQILQRRFHHECTNAALRQLRVADLWHARCYKLVMGGLEGLTGLPL